MKSILQLHTTWENPDSHTTWENPDSHTTRENPDSHTTCENSDESPWRRKTKTHIPCGACIYVKCSDDRYFRKPLVITGENVAEKFVDKIKELSKKIKLNLQNKIPIKKLTIEKKRCHKAPNTNCHIYEKKL